MFKCPRSSRDSNPEKRASYLALFTKSLKSGYRSFPSAEARAKEGEKYLACRPHLGFSLLPTSPSWTRPCLQCSRAECRRVSMHGYRSGLAPSVSGPYSPGHLPYLTLRYLTISSPESSSQGQTSTKVDMYGVVHGVWVRFSP